MKKLKIYLDTSTVSYLEAQNYPDRMKETHKLWKEIKAEKFEVFLSDTTLKEIGRCSQPKLKVLTDYLGEIKHTIISDSDEIDELAQMIVDMGILKEKDYDDCMHIASAVVGDCDVIVSWNFKHMVNIKTVRGVRAITILQGYNKSIDIVAPPSVLSENEEE